MSSVRNQEKFKILIVDDVKVNLIALSALLEREDVTIFLALSGVDALELTIKHDFCIAFLDVQMPEMNGFELAELMRGSKRTKYIPIIFVTASAHNPRLSFKGYESGAVDFLLKPLDIHTVRSKVNVFIEIYRQKKELQNQLIINQELLCDLNKSKRDAEKANAFKSQFLANMSHEIRSPLGVILGFSDLLKDPSNTPDVNLGYVSIVEKNSRQLLMLIDDILDLSKIESGMMTTENISFSLTEMIEELVTASTLKADNKAIAFRFTAENPLPETICSDPLRLRQILNNTIGNAIKFTDKGSVELTASFVDFTLRFSIKDTGIGISKHQEPRLFQAFSQADPSTTRKFGGTGLGLILSRRLAESLGGQLILASSEEEVGSTFVVEVKTTIPATLNPLKDEELSSLPSFHLECDISNLVLNGLKVLFVEDAPDNRFLITRYLESEGACVECAFNGAQGLNVALAKEFDVILMDIQMPIMDGHEATQKLRSMKYNKPIVAFTAHAMMEERTKCVESGFTEFLTKPILKQVLIDALAQYRPLTYRGNNSLEFGLIS